MRISDSIAAGYSASSISNSFLSGLNTSNSDLYSAFTDYSNLQKAGYRSLMRSVYSNQDNASKISSANTQTGAQINKIKTAFESISTSGSSLSKSASALSSSALYSEAESDPTKLVSAVKDFASDYNKVVDSLEETSSTELLRRGVFMTQTTASNSRLLADIGIKIGKDNKLTVDEEKLKKADLSTVKLLFSGNNSYGDMIAQKGSQISSNASRFSSSLPNVYKSDGSYQVKLPNGYLYNGKA